MCESLFLKTGDEYELKIIIQMEHAIRTRI